MSSWDWEQKEKEKVLMVDVVMIRGCLPVRAPHCCPGEDRACFQFCFLLPSYPAFSTTQLTTRVVSAASQFGLVDTVGWGEWCREVSATQREGTMSGAEDGRLLSPQNSPPPPTLVPFLLPGDCHHPVQVFKEVAAPQGWRTNDLEVQSFILIFILHFLKANTLYLFFTLLIQNF